MARPFRRKRDDQTAAAATPKKPGRFAQIRQVYTVSRQIDPKITLWMLLAAVGVLALAVGVGVLIGHPVYVTVLGLPLALLAAMVVMARRAERAAYRQLEGQPGGSGAALQALRRGWFYSQEPVAAEAVKPGDLSSAAMVFRAVGRPGIVLITEGPKARSLRLAEAEKKKVARVAPGVPVHVLRVGDAEDEVPVRKLSGKIQRMKPQLTKAEVQVVHKRLKAIGGVRPPVPKGIDPTRARVDRKAMRGR